jgi:hypothetical protein
MRVTLRIDEIVDLLQSHALGEIDLPEGRLQVALKLLDLMIDARPCRLTVAKRCRRLSTTLRCCCSRGSPPDPERLTCPRRDILRGVNGMLYGSEVRAIDLIPVFQQLDA